MSGNNGDVLLVYRKMGQMLEERNFWGNGAQSKIDERKPVDILKKLAMQRVIKISELGQRERSNVDRSGAYGRTKKKTIREGVQNLLPRRKGSSDSRKRK